MTEKGVYERIEDCSREEGAALYLAGVGSSLARCPDRCRRHLDTAFAWPVVKATKNAESFPLRYLARLREFLGADKLGFYAAKWDQTYVTSDLLWDGNKGSEWREATGLSKEESERQRAWLVRYEFNGGFPLSQRDLLYLIIEKVYEGNSTESNSEREIVYAYPSVSQTYAVRGLGVPPAVVVCRAPVRSKNLDPSVDRLRIVGDVVFLDHLMTTELCGWVPNCAYNHLLRPALVGAYAHEAEALRACVMGER